MNNKAHLTREGFDKILQIKANMNTGRVPTNASANNLADYRGYVCGDDPPIARKSPPGSLEGPIVLCPDRPGP
jgi:hypothetical protein